MLIRFPFFKIVPIVMTSFPILPRFFCSASMPVRIILISSLPNCVARFRYNLDNLTVVRTPNHVSIPDYFLWLGFLCDILVLFFFIDMVTSCRLIHILPRAVLVTVYFLVGVCALLGDVGVSFSAHLLHLAWAEASFEVLEVHSIE